MQQVYKAIFLLDRSSDTFMWSWLISNQPCCGNMDIKWPKKKKKEDMVECKRGITENRRGRDRQ